MQNLAVLALVRLSMLALICSVAAWKLSRALQAKALTLAGRSSANA